MMQNVTESLKEEKNLKMLMINTFQLWHYG